jgi:hypothetical protein
MPPFRKELRQLKQKRARRYAPGFCYQVFESVVFKGPNNECVIYEHYKPESATRRR